MRAAALRHTPSLAPQGVRARERAARAAADAGTHLRAVTCTRRSWPLSSRRMLLLQNSCMEWLGIPLCSNGVCERRASSGGWLHWQAVRVVEPAALGARLMRWWWSQLPWCLRSPGGPRHCLQRLPSAAAGCLWKPVALGFRFSKGAACLVPLDRRLAGQTPRGQCWQLPGIVRAGARISWPRGLLHACGAWDAACPAAWRCMPAASPAALNACGMAHPRQCNRDARGMLHSSGAVCCLGAAELRCGTASWARGAHKKGKRGTRHMHNDSN